MMDREGVQARDNKRPRSARLSPARELAPPKMAREERCFVIGVDGGTESIRAGVFTPRGELVATCSSEYPTHFPNPGWAEQHPEDWWRCMGEAVRGALGTGGVNAEEIKGISLTSTCCTVCVLDSQGRAMRPALLWMDMRSANETRRVLATGDPALEVNSAGCGPVSAEWMVPKALWISANEPALFRDCAMVCEYQDYINLHLTGRYWCVPASLQRSRTRKSHKGTTHLWVGY